MAGEYEKLELLGSGSYGKAWLVNCSKRNRQAVLKEIRLDGMSEKEAGQALVEVKVLARCRHVNIVSYCEAFVNSGCLHIVMEFADNGDLQKKILEQRGIHFDSKVIMDWFIQICFALKYLHSENILHRDLKPQNLFLTSEGIIKVGDFGIARVLHDTADHALTAIGTPYYLSPEICERKPYNYKSDMWSVGCVLYELCCLRLPFQAPNLPLLMLKIVDGCFDPIPSEYGAVLQDLVAVLLQTDAAQRPSAEQVLRVPALQRQVKATYKRCVSHRLERRRQRALSREVASPGGPFGEQAENPPQCRRTYLVKSPLLRRLSVATPKLRAALKRQRTTQSAEAVPLVEKRQKGSRPPVCNLQRVMIGYSPSSQGCPSDSEYPNSHGSNRADAVPDQTSEDAYDSDVFVEDSVSAPKGDETNISCLNRMTDDAETEKRLPCRLCDSDNSPRNARGKGDQPERRQDVETSNVQTHGKADPCRIARSLWEKHGKESEKLQNSDLDSVAQTHSETDPCHAEKSTLWDKQDEESEELAHFQKSQRTSNSDTYTVMDHSLSPEREANCPRCGNGTRPEHCLYEALYRASMLSHRDKASALRSLSRFLIAHLGSELSLQLCSLVNSAFRAREDFSSLNRLDKRFMKYLPAVFQLLSLNDVE